MYLAKLVIGLSIVLIFILMRFTPWCRLTYSFGFAPALARLQLLLWVVTIADSFLYLWAADHVGQAPPASLHKAAFFMVSINSLVFLASEFFATRFDSLNDRGINIGVRTSMVLTSQYYLLNGIILLFYIFKVIKSGECPEFDTVVFVAIVMSTILYLFTLRIITYQTKKYLPHGENY